MLSRLDDARVFLSSDDVVLGSSAARRGPGPGLRSQSAADQRGLDIDSESGSDGASFDDEEHAQLHPQHPYNLRKSRAAAAKTLALRSSRTGRRRLADSTASQPMEFVMLPSGDIRPRDKCPPGLALPPPPPTSRVGRRLEIGEMSDDIPRGHGRVREGEGEEDGSGENNQEKHGRPRPERTDGRRHVDDREGERERGYRPVTERRPRAQQPTADRRRSETPQRSTSASKRGGGVGYASSGDEDESGFAWTSSISSSGHAGASTRNGKASNATRRRHPQRIATTLRDDSDEDEDDVALHSRRRSASDARKERARQALMISRQRTPKTSSRPRLKQERSGQASRGGTAPPKKMDVAPVYHIADEDEDEDEDENERVEQVEKPVERTQRQRTPRADRKLDVNQLVSSMEENKTSKQSSQSKLVRQLEQELQNEKKRVLEKMTLLLEEQGKSQQLHRQIETLESQLESRTRDAASNASEATQNWEERVHAIERKHAEATKSMEEQLQQRDTVVLRLKQDKERLKDAISKLRERAGREKNGKHPQTETENDLKSQLDQLAASIRKFLKRVDRWKANSKEAMECCDRKTDLAALMGNMWLDFPQFPDWTDTSKSDNNAAEAPSGGHDENIVRFLKKRVRSREDELRQLQAKYVELKELCARQCVREADLQNFINEHRLRGNLIIRKGGSGDAEDTKKRTTPRQQREAEAPPSRRATKPGAYYADDDEDDDEYEENDHRGNNNDYESEEEEDEGEYPVREPKIFVQVGRDGVYEHTPGGTSAVLEKLADQQRRQGRKKASQVEVERIRLVPSPSLSQRYGRVATPTSNGTALSRKKKTQTLLQPLPRSGSAHTRPSANQPGASSSSSLARRRQPSTSLRSQPAASSRPIAAASARTTGGVGRPWV